MAMHRFVAVAMMAALACIEPSIDRVSAEPKLQKQRSNGDSPVLSSDGLRLALSNPVIKLPMQQKSRQLQAVPVPVQTYFVPLPEGDLINTLQTMNDKVRGDIVTLISIAVARDNTIIWYDHWEDSYETDVTSPMQNSTLVIGDGDVSNGALNNVTTDAEDVLTAGMSIILENVVPVSATDSSIEFDGRDKIQTSFPIAVTRGAYPQVPGSVLAGAVEVQDTDNWGKSFEIPVGSALSDPTEAFELAEVYVMAQDDNTNVTFGDTMISLKQGESTSFRVNQGDMITATRPIQADILVADIGSQWELRWYSLLPREFWRSEYFTPVGTAAGGKTATWLYNPNDFLIEVTSNVGGPYTIPPKDTVRSDFIPENKGARYESASGAAFYGVVQVDADCCNPEAPEGQVFDWGHPLIPGDQLTSQALVGLGYGCTANNCEDAGGPDSSKSVVFAMPVENATVCVDFDNDGYSEPRDVSYQMTELQGQRIFDADDNDMSGALVYGIRDGSCSSPGNPVDIAVAWGQDPSRVVENNDQAISLDLGTVVVPFPEIEASKSVVLEDTDNDGEVNLGDVLVYTILIQNTGKVRVPAGAFLVRDILPEGTDYVEGTTTYDSGSGASSVADDGSGTPFPLDGDGLALQSILETGSPHSITFKVTILTIDLLNSGIVEIVNEGDIYANGNPNSPDDTFRTVTPLVFNPSIAIENVAVLGPSGDCNRAVNLLQVGPNADVTYCFTVTNGGDTYLDTVTVTDAVLETRGGNYTGTVPTVLAPGESFRLTFDNNIKLDFFLNNTAVVSAVPTYADGAIISTLNAVTDEDDSAVQIVTAEPTVSPTVNPTANPTDLPTHNPTDEPTVTPTTSPSAVPTSLPTNFPTLVPTDGPTDGPTVSPTDVPTTKPSLPPSNRPTYKPSRSPTMMPSGEPTTSPTDLPSSVPTDKPTTLAPTEHPTMNPTASSPAVLIQNTVYLSQDGGKSCPGIEKVTDVAGTDVTYCFVVRNSGDTHLRNITVRNPVLEGDGNTINGDVPSLLAPGANFTLYIEDLLMADLINNATVTAIPAQVDGMPLSLPEVSDIDQSEVQVSTPEPSSSPTHRPTCGYPDIVVENTVYSGHDDGASCQGNETLIDYVGTPVTYCFQVINDGDMPLTSIVLENLALERLGGTIDGSIPPVLLPNESFTVYIEDVLVEGLSNTVTVTAKPTHSDGSPPPPRFDEVTDFDGSSVEVLTVEPTMVPTATPSSPPSGAPQAAPSKSPSANPSRAPIASPSMSPSVTPSKTPSMAPTDRPSMSPSFSPSHLPTKKPTSSPSENPTNVPTFEPSTKEPSPKAPNLSTSSPTKLPVPTSSHTQQPGTACPTTVSKCFDGTATFPIVKPGETVPQEVDCAWIAKKQIRQDSYCKDGSRAKEICRKSCDNCGFQPGDAKAPGTVSDPACEGTPAPMVSPSCKDSDDDVLVFTQRSLTKDCSWLASRSPKEIAYNCANPDLQLACPFTCSVCEMLNGCEDSLDEGTVVDPFTSMVKTCSYISRRSSRIAANCRIGSDGASKCLETCGCSPQLSCFADVTLKCTVDANGQDCDTFAATFKTTAQPSCIVPVTYAVSIEGNSTISSAVIGVDGSIEDAKGELSSLDTPASFSRSVEHDFCTGGEIIVQTEINGLEGCEDAAEYVITIPTDSPTVAPTEMPTGQPSPSPPSDEPTSDPTSQPSEMAISTPTLEPTHPPTSDPTEFRTCEVAVGVTCTAVAVAGTKQLSSNELCARRPTAMTFKYLGGACDQNTNFQDGEYSCNDIGSGPAKDGMAYITMANKNGNTVYFEDSVNVGDTFEVNLPDPEKFGTETRVYVEVGGVEAQYFGFLTNCLDNLYLNDIFGSLQVVGFTNEKQGVVSAVASQSAPAATLCSEIQAPETLSCSKRPTDMKLRYVGGTCDDTTNNQYDLVTCADADGGAPTKGKVFVQVDSESGGSRSKDTVVTYFKGEVEVGDTIDLDVGVGGVSSNVRFYVLVGGSVVQDVTFHASCSKPLAVFDQFGGIQVASYTNDYQGTVTAEFQATYTYTIKNVAPNVATSQVALQVDRDGTTNTLLTDGVFRNGNLVVEEYIPLRLQDKRYMTSTTAVVSSVTDQTGDSCSASATLDVKLPPAKPTPPPEGLCEGRPREMSLTYLGGDCSATTNTQSGTYWCEEPFKDVQAKASSATLIVTNKDRTITYFSGPVNKGETFDIDTSPGGGRVEANMITTIVVEGVAVQTVMFHSSCSKELVAGDIFGAIQVHSFVNKRQGIVVMKGGRI